MARSSCRSGQRRVAALLLALACYLYAPAFVPGVTSNRHAPSRHQALRDVRLRARGGDDAESLAVGDEVKALFPDDEQFYPGTIEKVGDGTCTVKWEDPDGGPETSEVSNADIKK
ncbi:unnamed protein product, partial [Effrenium voratum]